MSDQNRLQIAAEALLAGAELYCASDVPFFASQHRLNVGVSGFIASGLEYVSGQKREVLGKPSHYSMEIISEYLGHPASDILVIGDDITQFGAVGQAVKRYGHARRRTSMCRIKNMRTQGHGKTSVWQDWPHHKKARPIPIMAQRA